MKILKVIDFIGRPKFMGLVIAVVVIVKFIMDPQHKVSPYTSIVLMLAIIMFNMQVRERDE